MKVFKNYQPHLILIFLISFCIQSCSTFSITNYKDSGMGELLNEEIQVTIQAEESVTRGNPQKIRFNVSVEPDVKEAFRRAAVLEFTKAGFTLSNNGIPLRITLTNLAMGRTYVGITVRGYNNSGSIVFNKSYETRTLGREAKDEHKVTTIFAEEQTWNALAYTFRQMFSDREFWEYIQNYHASGGNL